MFRYNRGTSNQTDRLPIAVRAANRGGIRPFEVKVNAIGALFLVYAFRHGKAIVVAPLTNAGAPLATAVIALIVAGVMPGELKMVGLALAFVAAALLATAA